MMVAAIVMDIDKVGLLRPYLHLGTPQRPTTPWRWSTQLARYLTPVWPAAGSMDAEFSLPRPAPRKP